MLCLLLVADDVILIQLLFLIFLQKQGLSLSENINDGCVSKSEEKVYVSKTLNSFTEGNVLLHKTEQNNSGSCCSKVTDLKKSEKKSVYIIFCFRPRVIVVRLFSTTNPYTAKDGVSKSKGGSKEVSKKYSSTLFLPKTSFPVRVEGKKRTEKDAEIARSCGFESQYQWQRDNRRPGGKLSQSPDSLSFH